MIAPSASARGTLQEHLDVPQTWVHIIRAYSGMMGFYTVFVNRIDVRRDPQGEHDYWADPRSSIRAAGLSPRQHTDEEASLYGEVNLELVAQQRFKAPMLRDARLWILRQEINRLAAGRTDERGQGANPASPHSDKNETGL